MLVYRPAKKSLSAQILGNTFFQIFLLVALVGGAFGYLKMQSRAELASRIADIEDAGNTRLIDRKAVAAESADSSTTKTLSDQPTEQNVVEEASTQPSEAQAVAANDVAPAAAPALSNNAPPPVSAVALADQSGRAAASAPPTAGAAAGAGGGSAPQPATNIHISFAEVQDAVLDGLLAKAKDPSGYGPFNAGVIPNLESELKAAASGWLPLETETVQPLKLNQMIPVYKGTRDELSGQNLGLTIQVTPVGQDENGVQLVVETRRLLREPGATPPISEMAFPDERFVVPRGAAALIAGVLPRRPLQDDEARLYNTVNILKIMSKESYRSGNSELVIFIEPR